MGIGVSGTGLTSLVGAVGRAAPPEKRTSAIAALGMASGIGGFVAFPYTHLLMDLYGWQASLLLLLATTAIVMPLAWPLAGKPADNVEPDRPADAGRSLQGGPHAPELPAAGRRASSCAASTWRSTACICRRSWPTRASIAQRRRHRARPWSASPTSSAPIIAGQSGRFIEKRRGLSLIYFGRCFIFLGLLFLPITPTTDHRA